MTPPPAPAPRRGLLWSLGLHRPELRAWALYDWAISSMQTVITTAVFPIFFLKVAAADKPPEVATQWWGYANTIAAVVVAVMGPVLGAVADVRAAKKRFMAFFLMVGVVATAGMFFITHGALLLASVLFILAMGGATASLTFYESLLPHIATPEEIDRVSTAAYGLGYLGGGVLLAVNLWWISAPATFGLPSGEGLSPADATLPVRLAFVSVAVWWLLFSLPTLRGVPEPVRLREGDEAGGDAPLGQAIVMAFSRLGETLREMRQYRQAFLVMVAFTIYNDGIQTIIKMATAFGTEIGIGQSELITAILLVQFVGIPFAFLFGSLAGRIGAKRSILLGLAVYTGICVYGYFVDSTTDFFVLALLVALVQGGTQALSRSLFASVVPRHKSGEFFGFYSVFEKFGGILGPLVFALAVQGGGSSRVAILWVIAFFVVGGALLWRVDVAEGEQAARTADASTRVA
jgi:UMF1 family MFS transporter